MMQIRLQIMYTNLPDGVTDVVVGGVAVVTDGPVVCCVPVVVSATRCIISNVYYRCVPPSRQNARL